MATTIEDLKRFMDEANWKYDAHEDDGIIVTGFAIDPDEATYRDQDGDPHLQVIIRLAEHGELVAVFVPRAWNLAKCDHRGAVCEVVARAQARLMLVRFDLDDGDFLHANIEIPLEKAPMCSEQLHRAIRSVMTAVCRLDPVIRHALQTGLVDFSLVPESPPAHASEVDGILDVAADIGGLDAIERLLGGGDDLANEKAA